MFKHGDRLAKVSRSASRGKQLEDLFNGCNSRRLSHASTTSGSLNR